MTLIAVVALIVNCFIWYHAGKLIGWRQGANYVVDEWGKSIERSLKRTERFAELLKVPTQEDDNNRTHKTN